MSLMRHQPVFSLFYYEVAMENFSQYAIGKPFKWCGAFMRLRASIIAFQLKLLQLELKFYENLERLKQKCSMQKSAEQTHCGSVPLG
jgi:hypothetical protein